MTLFPTKNEKKLGKLTAKDLLVCNNKKFNRGTQTSDVLPVFKGPCMTKNQFIEFSFNYYFHKKIS